MSPQESRILWCWVEGDSTLDEVVDIPIGVNVFELKQVICQTIQNLHDTSASRLTLLKLNETVEIPIDPDNTLGQRLETLGDISAFSTKLSSAQILGTLFPEQPSRMNLHIVVQRPASEPPPPSKRPRLDDSGTAKSEFAPSSSQDTNLSQDSPPDWLVEIHKQLWGKSHLFGQIFRTANLTKADFIELQLQLESNDPSRNDPSYEAKDVLDIKAKFLREKSCEATAEIDSTSKRNLVPSVSLAAPPSMSAPPYAMDIDATAYRRDLNDSSEPSVISKISVPQAGLANASSTSKTRPGAPPVLDDTMNTDADADAEADPARQPVNRPDYIIADAEELSTGSTIVFPCIIRYMDLTVLKLEHKIGMKRLTLIRDEWNIMIDLFNRRTRGLFGSAIFTGSSGIGKTCLLYYILILCLIKAQPVVFQDIRGRVYIITNEVRSQTKKVKVPGDDVLTLVDADGETCKPRENLFDTPKLRILLTSSPRSKANRRWLRHDVGDEWAVYIMSPWSQNEWLVASLFIVEKDVTLNRFWETFKVCGPMPRQFLHAVGSRGALEDVRMQISSAIQKCNDIKGALNGIVGDDVVPHCAFVVYPHSEEARFLDGGIVKAISKGAMNTIVKTLDKQSAEAAFDLYNNIRGSPIATAFRGNLWERKVHGYLPWCACSFTIRSLNDASKSRLLDLSKGMKYFPFGPPQILSGKIADSVGAKESVYLQPISDNFASLDSIIYQPNCPLIGIQVTNASAHSIKTKGLKALQSLLSEKNASLSPLRPNSEKPWIIIFVVPTPMEKSFAKQSIEGDASTTWSKNTAQYVLGLNEDEVFRAQFRDEQDF